MSNTDAPWPWSQLGLDAPPASERDIRRAYAKRLKEIDADTDIEAFEALRAAYEFARTSGAAAPGSAENAHGSIANEFRQAPAAPNHPEPIFVTPPPAPPKDREDDTRPHDDDDRATPEPKPQKPSSKIRDPWTASDLSDPKVVLRKVHTLIDENNLNAKDWKALFDAPAVSDPDVSRQFQHQLVAYLTDRTESDGAPDVDHTHLYAAIDARFGWVSDGIGFLRHFPEARNLQATVAQILREDRWHVAPHTKPTERPSAASAKRIPPFMWMLPFIVWLLLIAV